MDGLDVLLEGAWENLRQPLLLGAFLMVVMQLFLRGIINMLRYMFVHYILKKDSDDILDAWDVRGLATNIVSFGLALLITSSFVGEGFSRGQMWYVSVVSTAVAIGSYEVLKNLLKPVGLVVPQGYKWH